MARMFIRFAAGLVLIRPSIAAWACGDDDSADDASDAQSVAVVAENTLVSPGKIGVPAGQEVTLKLENRDTIAHDLEVEGLEVEVIEGGSDRPERGGGGEHGDSAGVLGVHTEGGDTPRSRSWRTNPANTPTTARSPVTGTPG